MSPKLKEHCKRALVATGATRLAALGRPTGAAILMYHSVLDRPAEMMSILGGIAVQTEVFRKQIELLARKYNPVTLEEISSFVQGKKDLPKQAVAVTFDDGYVDNLDVAIPILNHYGVPAVFYVTVDCVERDTGPWVSRLRYAFHTNKKNRWSDATGNVWELSTWEKREEAYLAASEKCACLTGTAQEEFVKSVEDELEVDTLTATRKLMLTWEQVRAVVKSGHTIGSHTMTHPNMAHVKVEDLQHEFRESKQELERQMQSPVTHFAYPCPILQPHWTEDTMKICQSTGYSTGVTSNTGPVLAGANPFCLRRVPVPTEVGALHWNLESTFLGRSV